MKKLLFLSLFLFTAILLPSNNIQAAAEIDASFSVQGPRGNSQVTTINWSASKAVNVQIDFTCESDSIEFYVKEDNRTVRCKKGGLASYENQTRNSISIEPRGNYEKTVVEFTLTLMDESGEPYYSESKEVVYRAIQKEVTDTDTPIKPKNKSNVEITAFEVEGPTGLKQVTTVNWELSKPASPVLQFLCSDKKAIKFYVKESGKTYRCGDKITYKNQDHNALSFSAVDVKKKIDVELSLSLGKGKNVYEHESVRVTYSPSKASVSNTNAATLKRIQELKAEIERLESTLR